MPPFVIPPLIKMALGFAGAAAVMTWAVKEFQRLNEELAREKTVKVTEKVRPESLPKLQRDPNSGEYRVM